MLLVTFEGELSSNNDKANENVTGESKSTLFYDYFNLLKLYNVLGGGGDHSDTKFVESHS